MCCVPTEPQQIIRAAQFDATPSQEAAGHAGYEDPSHVEAGIEDQSLAEKPGDCQEAVCAIAPPGTSNNRPSPSCHRNRTVHTRRFPT
jgi:hypothetical protein